MFQVNFLIPRDILSQGLVKHPVSQVASLNSVAVEAPVKGDGGPIGFGHPCPLEG